MDHKPAEIWLYTYYHIDINTVGIMSAKKISKQFVKWCIGCLILKANASNIGMYVLAKMMVLPTKKELQKFQNIDNVMA